MKDPLQKGSSARYRLGNSMMLDAFFGCWFVEALRMAGGFGSPDRLWPEGALLITSIAALAGSFSQALPLPNVLIAFALTGAAGAATHAASAAIGFPLGRISFHPQAGFEILNLVPWTVPLIWIVVLFSARGAARYALRASQKNSNYGLRASALTVGLAMALDLGIELYAVEGLHAWSWSAPGSGPGWRGIPGAYFLVWPVIAIVLGFAATPLLIDKRPVEWPPTWIPAVLYSLLILMLGTWAWMNQFWLAGVVSTFALATMVLMAVPGSHPHPTGPTSAS